MSKFDEHITPYDYIILGSTLPALIHSFCGNVPFVYGELQKPDPYLHWSMVRNTHYILELLEAVHLPLHSNPIDLWERLWALCGLAGLNLGGDKVDNIRIFDDCFLKVFTKNARMAQFKVNKFFVYSERGVHGLPPPVKYSEHVYRVVDYFKIKADKHKIGVLDLAQSPDGFINKAFFDSQKDLVAISNLNRQHLEDPAYSDVRARFQIMHELKLLGLRGPNNGKDTKTGKPKHYALKVEHMKRDVSLNPVCRDYYNNTQNLEFRYETVQDLWKFFSQKNLPNFRLLEKLLDEHK